MRVKGDVAARGGTEVDRLRERRKSSVEVRGWYRGRDPEGTGPRFTPRERARGGEKVVWTVSNTGGGEHRRSNPRWGRGVRTSWSVSPSGVGHVHLTLSRRYTSPRTSGTVSERSGTEGWVVRGRGKGTKDKVLMWSRKG